MKALKSFLLSLLSCVAIAYTGAFFEIWKLPRHDDMYTYHDLAKVVKPWFGFTDDLREIRDGEIAEKERIFAEKEKRPK